MLKAILVGGASVVLGIAGIAALGVKSTMDLDYQSMDEAGQQRFLDNIVTGFKGGFSASAGGQANITYITASAANDVIAADIKFTDARVEQVTGQATELLRKQLYGQYCNYFGGEKLNDSGVTFKMRLMRPSGAPITTVLFNTETCAPHLRTASN